MGILEKSTAYPSIFAESHFAKVRMKVAMERLKIDVRVELLRIGADISDQAVERIIDGLPSEILAKELSART